VRQCEAFDGMSNSGCCYAHGHSGDHYFSRMDETDRIRWKLASDQRDTLAAELTTLRARVGELEREREAFAPPVELMQKRIERDTAERIATWLVADDGAKCTPGSGMVTLAHAAADIRAGAWRDGKGE
jgi:hypothetical protein